MNLTLLAAIANAFSLLSKNPAFGKTGEEVSAIVGLVGLAFTAGGMIDAERKLLLDQIEVANAEGRGLTDIEMQVWKDRHAAAAAAIQAWQPGG
jgi:hypothetical protein